MVAIIVLAKLSCVVFLVEVLSQWSCLLLIYLSYFLCALAGSVPYASQEISTTGAHCKRTRRLTFVAILAINS